MYACSEELKTASIVDGFFQVTAEFQRMPIEKCGQHLITQMVRLCFYNTVVCLCFFRISAEFPSRFIEEEEMCSRVGNEMPCQRKCLVTKRWVQLDNKRWRRTSLWDVTPSDVHRP